MVTGHIIIFFLPSIDTSLKDGLFHEFKKHGKVTSVQIHGATEDRYGLVFFRQQEDRSGESPHRLQRKAVLWHAY